MNKKMYCEVLLNKPCTNIMPLYNSGYLQIDLQEEVIGLKFFSFLIHAWILNSKYVFGLENFHILWYGHESDNILI